MNQATARKSKLAAFSLRFGLLATVLPALGALGARAGVWPSIAGVLLAPLGLLLGVAGLLLGLKALSRQWGTQEPLSATAASGAALSALIALHLGGVVLSAFTVAPIHNISTDIEDPPEFTIAASLRGEGANPLFYDSETIGPLQRESYPELGPLNIDLPPVQAYELVRGVLVDMGLELVREAPEHGEIEAVATTFWFGFKDDLVVRLRETDTGTRMDVRSVSRVGVVDLGANAERIFEIIDRVEAARLLYAGKDAFEFGDIVVGYNEFAFALGGVPDGDLGAEFFGKGIFEAGKVGVAFAGAWRGIGARQMAADEIFGLAHG